MKHALEQAWKASWESLGLSPNMPLFTKLLKAYGEEHRAYHSVQHLEECLKHFHAISDSLHRPGEVALALFFHDAIYDTHSRDSELRSAQWAQRELLEAGANENVGMRVKNLILATQHEARLLDHDAQFLIDIDLAILGSEPERFQQYESQVRQEYLWVPKEQFTAGRSAILRTFLERSPLYLSAYFQKRFEARARQNLRNALEALSWG